MLNMLLTILTRATQQTWAQTVHGPNPFFASYLQAGELPDGTVMPLFQEVWRIVGNDLNATNFTAKVDQVAETIFAAYSYQGKATGFRVSDAAPTHFDGQLGELIVCTVILCIHVSVYQQHDCLSVNASSRSDFCVLDSCKTLRRTFDISCCIVKIAGSTSCIQWLVVTMQSAICITSMHNDCPLQTDINCAFAVSPEQLANNATSDMLYLNYNSVDVHLNVTINNKAWYPDLGSVASTNHNRLANILTGEGFTVVRTIACITCIMFASSPCMCAHSFLYQAESI